MKLYYTIHQKGMTWLQIVSQLDLHANKVSKIHRGESLFLLVAYQEISMGCTKILFVNTVYSDPSYTCWIIREGWSDDDDSLSLENTAGEHDVFFSNLMETKDTFKARKFDESNFYCVIEAGGNGCWWFAIKLQMFLGSCSSLFSFPSALLIAKCHIYYIVLY